MRFNLIHIWEWPINSKVQWKLKWASPRDKRKWQKVSKVFIDSNFQAIKVLRIWESTREINFKKSHSESFIINLETMPHSRRVHSNGKDAKFEFEAIFWRYKAFFLRYHWVRRDIYDPCETHRNWLNIYCLRILPEMIFIDINLYKLNIQIWIRLTY